MTIINIGEHKICTEYRAGEFVEYVRIIEEFAIKEIISVANCDFIVTIM